MIKWLKNFRKRKEETLKVEVVPQWRNELTVYQKSGRKIVLWSETTDGEKGDICDAWDDLLEWFELKTNKPYVRINGNQFKTMLVRDNIESIMTTVTKIK